MRIVPGSHSAQTPQGRNGMAPLLKAAEAPSWPPQPLGAFLCAAISVYCKAYRKFYSIACGNRGSGRRGGGMSEDMKIRARVVRKWKKGWFRKVLVYQAVHLQQFIGGEWMDIPLVEEDVTQ